ncbi:hypothetical protein [Streptomyces sp. NPDC005989]|uniref:hypothetical protein n=1 Tax=Streptomyces sp. NPDC005989 TaxID=3156727 RepID=UPI0033D0C9AB
MDLQQHGRILLTVHQCLDPALQLLQHPAATQPPQPGGERRKFHARLCHRQLDLGRAGPRRRGPYRTTGTMAGDAAPGGARRRR